MYHADDPEGFGPALQVVAEHGSMLMDSVTVLLHRLGVGYTAIMTPVFDVRRSPAGELLRIEPKAVGTSPYTGEAWIFVQLAPSVDRNALTEVERLLPRVLADVQRVATDAAAMIATLSELAEAVDTDPEGQYAAPDRQEVAALLRWLGNGNFLLLGYQPCRVDEGMVIGDGSSGLGVLRARAGIRPG
ncbi:bacterial NAD-glutamate dehydrogenase family protein [Mycobacterium kansasii]|uniref:Bacterial NAD-glutamate dehydrogenase family protein n=1 Tax=Mycobacterium kansasii TaxID=1768 RepID=A0A1V3XLX9_MYCKA|nr:bacterial NAD-glutamate dehydrogenase family protein [Mycobacterium kansasii]